jgi:hypothetical protein
MLLDMLAISFIFGALSIFYGYFGFPSEKLPRQPFDLLFFTTLLVTSVCWLIWETRILGTPIMSVAGQVVLIGWLCRFAYRKWTQRSATLRAEG